MALRCGPSSSALLLTLAVALGSQVAVVGGAESEEMVAGAIHLDKVYKVGKFVKDETIHDIAAGCIAEIAGVNQGCIYNLFLTYVPAEFGDGVQMDKANVMFEINSTTAGLAQETIRSRLEAADTSAMTATFLWRVPPATACENTTDAKTGCSDSHSSSCQCLEVTGIHHGPPINGNGEVTSGAAGSARAGLFSLAALSVAGLAAWGRQ